MTPISIETAKTVFFGFVIGGSLLISFAREYPITSSYLVILALALVVLWLMQEE